MSFDLAVWHETTPITTQDAVHKYHALCEGDTEMVHAHPSVDAFYDELTGRYPELDTYPEANLEECPWTSALDRSPAHVIVGIAWSRVDEVGPVVADLASRLGLVCLDPQVPVVHYPPSLARIPHLRLSMADGRVADNPTAGEVSEAIASITSEGNYFAILERTNLTYMQAEIASNVELFALEYQDGALGKHFRIERIGRGEVLRAFQEYARGDEAWRSRYRWRRIRL